MPRQARPSHCAALSIALAGLLLPACGKEGEPKDHVPAPSAAASAVSSALASASALAASPRAPGAPAASGAESADAPLPPITKGCDVVPVYGRGRRLGEICASDASAHGYSVVDLSDGWTPRAFAPQGSGAAPPYRKTYVKLANGKAWEKDLELYGIFPSLSVLSARLRDRARHACHDAVDGAPLDALEGSLPATLLVQESRRRDELESLEGKLDRARKKGKDDAALARDPELGPALKEARALRAISDALEAAQAHLRCEGFLPKGVERKSFGWNTTHALDLYRRRHMIVSPGGLDLPTALTLATPSRELELRAALRALRERVADATGLVEDGTASGVQARVAGRVLDVGEFRALDAQPALREGAGDLVGEATDAAARALGWTGPDELEAFFDGLGRPGLVKLKVAVKLPPPPAYHSASMDLRVEIDRGDVFRDRAAKRRVKDPRRPELVLYARHAGVERPLVRWPTTIGGWQKERDEEGEVRAKFKESDVGDRVWRDLIVSPAWLPPDSTPEAELLVKGKDGWQVKKQLLEPGYRNAYGLAMLIHHEVKEKDGETRFLDNGIRTHGSVSFRSITRGDSHGCHRLFNHLALRLADFLIMHRPLARKGKLSTGYQRKLEWEGETIEIDMKERGYLYELDPPVPVRVLEGRIGGKPTRSAQLRPASHEG